MNSWREDEFNNEDGLGGLGLLQEAVAAQGDENQGLMPPCDDADACSVRWG